MYEYHVFLHHYDDPRCGPSSTVFVDAVSDEAVREAFPHADRIYRYTVREGLVRVA